MLDLLVSLTPKDYFLTITFKNLLISLLLVAPTFAQQPVWAQCGGQGWTGGTSCVSGTTCVYSNPWYSQCLPGAASTPSTTSPTPTPTPTSTPPTTSTPNSSTPAPTSTNCPTLPSSLTLKAVSKLPDPFTFAADGSKVTTKAQWQCRRQELSQLFQRYELGTLPPKPSSITGSYSGNTLTINVNNGGTSISFSVGVQLPSSGTAPFPAIIAIGGLSIPTPAGVAVLTFNNDDIAQQTNSGSRGKGKFYTLYGSSATASALTAWAWGVSRIIDVLEVTPSAKIDVSRLAVSGCSRNGKGAMVVGAFEPRIALTIPQESGSGGAGCWRISDSMRAAGVDTQTASQIVGENVWFSTNFANYVNQVRNLPFDHHLLASLIAPRALLVIDHSGIDWLGPKSVWGCMRTANKIWQALGVSSNMGISQAGNHNHCSFPSSQQGDLDAFINKFLKGQNTNTAIIKTDGSNNLGFNEAEWVDWSVPALA